MAYKSLARDGTVILGQGAEIPDRTEARIGTAPVGARDLESLLLEATLDDALENFYLLHKVNRGLRQADQGQTVSHEEAGECLRKWLESGEPAGDRRHRRPL